MVQLIVRLLLFCIETSNLCGSGLQSNVIHAIRFLFDSAFLLIGQYYPRPEMSVHGV